MTSDNKYELVRVFSIPMRITMVTIGIIFLLVCNAIHNQHQVPVPISIYITALFIPFFLIILPLVAIIVEDDGIKARVKKDIIQKHKEKYAEYLKNRR